MQVPYLRNMMHNVLIVCPKGWVSRKLDIMGLYEISKSSLEAQLINQTPVFSQD